jgi:hypothetical protein
MMKMKSLNLLVAGTSLFLLFMGVSTQLHAEDCYVPKPVLIDGKERPNEPVCEVLAKNLNRFCDSPPMVCGLKIHPNFRKELAIPDWRPLAHQTDLRRIEEFIRAPWETSNTRKFEDDAWKREFPVIRTAIEERRLHAAEAPVDIYNLGKKQPAYRLDLGTCERDNPQVKDPKNKESWGQELRNNNIRIQHVPPVIRKLFKQYFPIGAGTIDGDIFTFSGGAYAYFMSGYEDNSATGEIVNHLRVNRYEVVKLHAEQLRLAMDNICLFEYHPYQEIPK